MRTRLSPACLRGPGPRPFVLVWGKTVVIDENGKRMPMHYEISDLNSPISVYSPDPAVRFRRLLRNIWWVDGPFYGVMRSSALRATRWVHRPHHSGDQILLAELSMKGRFCEIPEELFFSRVHAGKTSHAHRTLRDRANLVDQREPGAGPIASLRALRAYPSGSGCTRLPSPEPRSLRQRSCDVPGRSRARSASGSCCELAS